MNTDKWYGFDKVDCITKISDSNTDLLLAIDYCSVEEIRNMIRKQINSNLDVIKKIIETGVFENEE